ncbi:MAG: site-specific integrase [Myxococcota bacterium]|nr:site-specific integrase [Myxococcota bacterium]
MRSLINQEFLMTAYRDNRTGAWRYRKWIQLPNGTRERITGTPNTDTKVAAESAERMHIDRVLHPERVQAIQQTEATQRAKEATPETPTLREYAPNFMAGYLPDQKPSERKAKNQILDGHILPALGHLQLDQIVQSDVDALVAREIKRGISKKTINNRLAVLSSLLKYAHENKLIAKPTLRLFLKRKGAAKDAPIVAVTRDDVAKLLAAATDDRYRTAILLASEAGLRIGEVLGLQWGDIKAGELKVRRAVDSDGNVGLPKHDKTRDVPLSPALVSELGKMPRRGLWIVGRLDGDLLSYAAAREALHELYVRAGVTVPVSETGITMPWHSLRHSFGTDCAARGVPLAALQGLMGHEKIETTLRYVSVSKDQKRAAIALAFGQQVGNTLPENLSRSKSSTEN